jgi:hypothetical protein
MPGNGQALVWSSAVNKWVPGTVASGGSGGSTGSVQVSKNSYTSSAGQTQFSLSTMPSNINSVNVFVNSIYQTAGSYTLAGSTVTLTTVPATGSVVELVVVSGATGVSGARVTSADAPPSDPYNGDLWFNSTIGQLLIYYNGFWIQPITGDTGPTGYTGSIGGYGYSGSIGYVGSKGESSFTFSSTAPSNPVIGDRWLDSVTMAETVWTNDGDSNQWVEVAGTGFLGQTGYVGSTGALGYTGSTGAGFVGSAGYTGSVGFVGSVGYAGSTGFTGSVGYTGSAGFVGSVGYAGSTGYTGSVGIGYAGSAGFVGSVGYVGSASTAVGYTGSRGIDGVIGYNGSTGYTGSASTVAGYAGSRGQDGVIGYNGSTGYSGSIGYTGSSAAFPSQTGNSGRYLTTDGTTVSWASVVTVSNTTPATTVPGALWLDSDELKLSAYLGGSWLDVSGPAGYTGSASTAVGYTGSIGVGYTGSVGIGYAGSAGSNGFTGSAGSNGSNGYTGSVGSGYNGSMGYTGSIGVGYTGSAGAGGSPGGSNTQIQYNNSGSFAGNANLTFNGTGITVGNVNVNSATAPTNGIFLNSTASSGLSFKNAGASGNGGTIIQTYYGMANIGASTNSVPNSPIQFFGFGNDVAPQISSSTAAGNPSYYFTGNGHSLIDQPAVMYIHGGSRGDNTDYTAPEENGVLFVNHTSARGGNVARGKNGIFVKNSSPGLYGAKNGIKVVSDSYQSEIHGVYSLVRPGDPNGGGAPAAFYAQTDNSNTIYDNCTPICVYMDNAPSDNFAKNNGNGPLMISLDRRSGATSYQAVRFCRNSAGNIVGTITTTSSATAYSTSSDYRLKDNPQPLSGSGAFIDALQPKTWTWKIDGRRGVGFIAHEVQEVSPDSVHGAKDAVDNQDNPVIQAMEYGSAEFIANIVAELQSLRTRVAELESKLT